MSIHDHSNYAIKGSSVINFTLADSTVTGVNGTLIERRQRDRVRQPQRHGQLPARHHLRRGFCDNLDITNTTGTLTVNIGGNTVADATTIGLNQTNGADGVFLRPRRGRHDDHREREEQHVQRSASVDVPQPTR